MRILFKEAQTVSDYSNFVVCSNEKFNTAQLENFEQRKLFVPSYDELSYKSPEERNTYFAQLVTHLNDQNAELFFQYLYHSRKNSCCRRNWQELPMCEFVIDNKLGNVTNLVLIYLLYLSLNQCCSKDFAEYDVTWGVEEKLIISKCVLYNNYKQWFLLHHNQRFLKKHNQYPSFLKTIYNISPSKKKL